MAVLGAALLSCAGFLTVYAHAEPATARPGDGAVVTSPPPEIVLTMSQDMFDREGANDIDVVDAAGTEVTTVAAVLDRSNRKRLSVSLPSNLAPGVYTVKWKTLSADDGDPGAGTLKFTYDPNGKADPGKEEIKGDLLDPGATPEGETSAPSLAAADDPDGVTWVLVVAVGAAMFALGAGGTFLLVQRQRP